jgi:hypothetical protein
MRIRNGIVCEVTRDAGLSLFSQPSEIILDRSGYGISIVHRVGMQEAILYQYRGHVGIVDNRGHALASRFAPPPYRTPLGITQRHGARLQD